MRRRLFFEPMLAALAGSVLLLAHPDPRVQLRSVLLLAVAALCWGLYSGQIWPQTLSRRPKPDRVPEFEVLNPHEQGAADSATPLIQAMLKVRGKRPQSKD